MHSDLFARFWRIMTGDMNKKAMLTRYDVLPKLNAVYEPGAIRASAVVLSTYHERETRSHGTE